MKELVVPLADVTVTQKTASPPSISPTPSLSQEVCCQPKLLFYTWVDMLRV